MHNWITIYKTLSRNKRNKMLVDMKEINLKGKELTPQTMSYVLNIFAELSSGGKGSKEKQPFPPNFEYSLKSTDKPAGKVSTKERR